MIVTAVSPNGSLQVTVNIDLSDTDTTNRFKRDTNTEQTSPNYVELSDMDSADSDADVQKWSPNYSQTVPKTSLTKRQSGSIAKVPVTVTYCNEPEPNAQVFANALLDYRNTPNGPWWTGVTNYMAVHTSNPGVYHIQIPTQPASMLGKEISEVCNKIIGIIGQGCTSLSLINPVWEIRVCAAIATAVEVITVPVPGDSAAIFVACEVTFRAFQLYCDTLGASPGPGAPSTADAICSSITVTDDAIDFFKTKTIHLQPYAIFPAGNRVNAVGQSFDIQPGASGLLPYSFTIEDENTVPTLTLLVVTPSDPVPGEDYVVDVTYTCITPSVVVTMHIIGTDLYEDFTICHGNSSCTLYVPGATALVLDLITITITEPTQGYSFTRQVVIIF